jgi:hypothetical protein
MVETAAYPYTNNLDIKPVTPSTSYEPVIAGLDPAIHAEASILRPASMDARVTPTHDDETVFQPDWNLL